MAVGIATAAVVTAQIASSFMDQASARRTSAATADPAPMSGSDPTPSPARRRGRRAVHARLERIEQLLLARLPSEDRPVTGEADPPA